MQNRYHLEVQIQCRFDCLENRYSFFSRKAPHTPNYKTNDGCFSSGLGRWRRKPLVNPGAGEAAAGVDEG
jgi:hypothetical protein